MKSPGNYKCHVYFKIVKESTGMYGGGSVKISKVVFTN